MIAIKVYFSYLFQKYKVDGATVYLSMDVSDDLNIYCDNNLNYKYANDTANTKLRAFVLTMQSPIGKSCIIYVVMEASFVLVGSCRWTERFNDH